MHHTEHTFIERFARKNPVSGMYAHITIQHIAIALIGIFIPIYFYTLGFTIAQILFFEFLYALYYIVCTPLAVEIIRATCINKAFLVSFPFRIIFFLLLVYIPQYPWLFYLLPAVLAIRFAIFNIAFHANMLAHEQNNRTGRTMARYYILTSLASFMAPYIGSLIITWWGFEFIIHVSIAILLIGALPLFGVSETCPLPKEFNHRRVWTGIFDRRKNTLTASHAGYAVEALIGKILWPLFLFIFLGSIEAVGLITSLSLLIAAAAFYVIGRWTDGRDRKHLIAVGTRAYAVSWVLRIGGINPTFAVISDVFRNVAEKLMLIPWSAYSYEVARMRYPYEYIVTREIVINGFRVMIIPLLMLLFMYVPIFTAFVIAFICAALMTFLIPKITEFVSE